MLASFLFSWCSGILNKLLRPCQLEKKSNSFLIYLIKDFLHLLSVIKYTTMHGAVLLKY